MKVTSCRDESNVQKFHLYVVSIGVQKPGVDRMSVCVTHICQALMHPRLVIDAEELNKILPCQACLIARSEEDCKKLV